MILNDCILFYGQEIKLKRGSPQSKWDLSPALPCLKTQIISLWCTFGHAFNQAITFEVSGALQRLLGIPKFLPVRYLVTSQQWVLVTYLTPGDLIRLKKNKTTS